MNTEDRIEDRLTSLESARAILNKIALEQLSRLRDLEHNVTILLGVQGSQGQDIGQMKTDLSRISERLERMESQFTERFDTIIALLSKSNKSPE